MSAAFASDRIGATAERVRTLSFVARNRLLDDAYNEFCDLQDTGRIVEVEEFCARHSAVRSSLRRLIDAHLFLDNSPLLGCAWAGHWPEPGDSLFGFELLAELGRGSFARVFLARQRAVGGRLVVVKISPHASGEAKFLGQLPHPSIVPAYSAERDELTGLSVICMPYRGAATANDLLDEAFKPGACRTAALVRQVAASRCDPLPTELEPRPGARFASYEAAIVDLVRQALAGLAFAHSRGVLHGDLKPSNLLLTPGGRALLIDFNLADAGAADGLVGGTLSYMAPERLALLKRGAEAGPPRLDASPAADLYSMGVLLHELLTGKLPFETEPGSLPAPLLAERLLARQRQAGPFRSPAVRKLDRRLAQIVEKALRFRPEERYAAAAEMQRDLERWSGWRARAGRWAGKRWGWLAAGAAGAAIAAGIGAFVSAHQADPEWERAQAGIRLLEQQDHTAAIDLLSAEIRRDPNSARLLECRALARMRMGLFGPARDDCNEALKLQPRQPVANAIYAYSACMDGLGGDISTVFAWRRAIEFGLDNAGACHNLGMSLFLSGSPAESIAWFDLALKHDPELAPAYLFRAKFRRNAVQAPGEGQRIWLAVADAERAAELAGFAEAHRLVAHMRSAMPGNASPADRKTLCFHAAEAARRGCGANEILVGGLAAAIFGDPLLLHAVLQQGGAPPPKPVPSFLDPLK